MPYTIMWSIPVPGLELVKTVSESEMYTTVFSDPLLEEFVCTKLSYYYT
jgi:hypothetical protein